MRFLNPSSTLPPAVLLSSSRYEETFLIGAGFAGFIVSLILFFLVYATGKNYKAWQAGDGIIREVLRLLLKQTTVFSGPLLFSIYFMALSMTWSVEIGAQGIRLNNPLNPIDRSGTLTWAEVEKGKVIRRGKGGGVPYISLSGQGTRITFPIWDMSYENAALTCEMIFSKLQESQLTQSRPTIKRACTYYNAPAWLPERVMLTRLYPGSF